jgi:hypothetical protein
MHPFALFAMCWDEIAHNSNGGDFRDRLDLAFRHALGTCAYFSIMSFTGQQIFLSYWVGNIYVQNVILCRTVGAAVPFAAGAIRDLVFATCLAWAINEILQRLGTVVFASLLPVVAGLMAFTILVCPQIEGKALAQVVTILILPNNLYATTDPLFALRLAGGFGVAALVGLGVLLLPLPRPATAARTLRGLLGEVEGNVEALLLGIRSFTFAAASDPSEQHLAVSSIERAIARFNKSCDQLIRHAEAAEIEQYLFLRRQSCMLATNWSTFLVQQQTHLNTIRIAATQRLEFTTQTHPMVRQVNIALTSGLKEAVSNIVSSTTAAMEIGVRSNGLDRHVPETADTHEHARQLRAAVHTFQEAWKVVIPEVDLLLISEQHCEQPQLSFILRRMILSRGLALFCEGLAAFLETDNVRQPLEKNCYKQFQDFIRRPWPRCSWDDMLMPLKGGLGVAIASLWISIPYLAEKASPFATFPAITVACVQTGLPGSSFVKCVDRLWATLLACAFALLLAFLFQDEYIAANAYINTAGATFFTFFMMYLRVSERPYRQDYAAQSIGFILFGSGATGIYLPGLVYLRVVLILIGTIIFLFVECFLWPRSSRRVVQEKSLTFLHDTDDCLHKALLTMRSMAIFTPAHNEFTELSYKNGEKSSNGHDSHLFTSQVKDESLTKQLVDDLSDCCTRARQTVDMLETEIEGALDEPLLGFSLAMKKSAWVGLVHQESECEVQMRLLLNEVQSLHELYAQDTKENNHRFQRLDWSSSVADMIELAAKHLRKCNHQLNIAFPNGRIQQQDGNSFEATKAVSCFKDFDHVGQEILEIWSVQYYNWLQIKENSIESGAPDEEQESLVLIVSQCMTTSILLEICRHLQNTGHNLEAIACDFHD